MFSPTALHRGHDFEGPLIGRIQPRPPQRSQSLSASIVISELGGATYDSTGWLHTHPPQSAAHLLPLGLGCPHSHSAGLDDAAACAQNRSAISVVRQYLLRGPPASAFH